MFSKVFERKYLIRHKDCILNFSKEENNSDSFPLWTVEGTQVLECQDYNLNFMLDILELVVN